MLSARLADGATGAAPRGHVNAGGTRASINTLRRDAKRMPAIVGYFSSETSSFAASAEDAGF